MIRILQHLNEFNLRYAPLGEQEGSVTRSFGRPAAVEYRDHEFEHLPASLGLVDSDIAANQAQRCRKTIARPRKNIVNIWRHFR
ncbi:hypothetical protein AB1286_30340 [Trinickia sp. NRRL B-1857]|uniref:hypothetical protein n=1 Tax=Trinickia sp. NRRL B-1857 TaxID=3162879 RepID=UPI003D2DFBA9